MGETRRKKILKVTGYGTDQNVLKNKDGAAR